MSLIQAGNKEIKISIIIPVYNAEKYLSKCLDSVRYQSYKNIEVILVDDGSIDSSNSICDEYAVADSRFTSIHLENGGVSKARNVGIEKSSGEFLMFVDSDDWLEENAVELLINKVYHSSKTDFVVASNYDIYDGRKKLRLLVTQEIELEKNELSHFCKNNYLMFATPWAKLYRKKLIEQWNIRFDEQVKYGEDMLFNMFFLKYSTSISILKDPVYNYQLLVEGSAQSKYFSDMWIYRIKVYTAVCDLVGKELEDIAVYFLGTGLGHYGTYIEEKSSYIGIEELINYFSGRIGKEVLRNKFGYFKGNMIYKEKTKILYYLILFKSYIRRRKR